MNPSKQRIGLRVFGFLLLGCISVSANQSASVYQYQVQVGQQGHAFLWLPPASPMIRGLIYSMDNLLERNWLDDPIVRQTAAEQGLGIIYLTGRDPSINWRMESESVTVFERMLDDLAEVSGYREIASAPILWMGHSFHGRTWIFAGAMPERSIAAIAIRTYPMPETSNFEGIPLLYLVGQTTELPQFNDGRPSDRDFFWPIVRDTSLALRAADPNNLIGVAVYPGGTHTDWSEDQSRFVSLFIRKACERRLPQAFPADGSVTLRSVSPQSGWLTDSGLLEPDRFAPAPYAEYQGDRKQSYWFFDEQMARAAVVIDGDRCSRENQMVTFSQNGGMLPVKLGLNGVRLAFQPQADGQTFQVTGGFLKEIPPGLVNAGEPLGHAASGEFIFRKICGPIVQTGRDTFRIQFDGQGSDAQASILVSHPGDEHYRPAMQSALVSFPESLTEGTAQTITFPEIQDITQDVTSIDLDATSDSGLPVDYDVVMGPAVIDSGILKIVQLPVRTRYPVKIAVTAYQWGRTIEPLYQSAKPVERSFFITK